MTKKSKITTITIKFFNIGPMNAYRIPIPFIFLKPFFLITTGIVPPFVYSQQDCFSAINISYDTTLHFPFIQGYGKMKEITGHSLGDSIYFPEETSSCWFRITPLSFYITISSEPLYS